MLLLHNFAALDLPTKSESNINDCNLLKDLRILDE